MEITWSAVRCVRRSSARSPRYGTLRARRGSATGRAPGTGRGGRTRTWCGRAQRSKSASRPEDVWRVARLQHREPAFAARLERLPRCRAERVRVLGDEAQLAAAGRVRLVLVQLHGVDDLVATGSPLPLGHTTDDPIARRHESLAFEPDPPVEGHRKVLDNDQYPSIHEHTNAGLTVLIRRAMTCLPLVPSVSSRGGPDVSRRDRRGSYISGTAGSRAAAPPPVDPGSSS